MPQFCMNFLKANFLRRRYDFCFVDCSFRAEGLAAIGSGKPFVEFNGTIRNADRLFQLLTPLVNNAKDRW